MSLKYISRFQFNDDLEEEDFGNDLAVEIGQIQSEIDPTYGKVLLLDGATSLMASGDYTSISGDTDRSFSFWAKNDTTLIENPILSYGDLSGEAFILYTDNTSSHPEISTLIDTYETSHVTVISEWRHYCVTYTSGVLTYYVDSSVVGSFSPTLSTGTGDSLRLGTDAQGAYFTGSISDLRIYDNVLDPTVVSFLFSVGPNFEEKIDVDFVEKVDDFGLAVSSTMMSRSEYSINQSGETIRNSFYVKDDTDQLQEASRIEYTKDGSSSISIKTRHEDTLYSSIDMDSEKTTFTNVDDSDNSSSIVFSSEGVSITSGNPGLFFGASKDFRMSVDGDTFVIEAFNNSTGQYDKKMEVGK